MSQGIPEDGNIVTAQFTGVADGAMYGPASKLNVVLLNDLSFIIDIIHCDLGAGTVLGFKDPL